MAPNKKDFKEAQFVRFYNAGDRVSEPLNFSIPDRGDIHAVARWSLEAPEDSFFNVPQVLLLADGAKINVDFPNTVARKFGERGIIMIAPDLAPLDPDDEAEEKTLPFPEAQPFARSDEEASEKGKEFWRSFLERIARAHINQCQQARAAGGWPVEASGFTKRALKIMGWQDPAVMMMDQLKVTTGSAEATPAAPSDNKRIKELEESLASLAATLQTILKNQTDSKSVEALNQVNDIESVIRNGRKKPGSKKR